MSSVQRFRKSPKTIEAVQLRTVADMRDAVAWVYRTSQYGRSAWVRGENQQRPMLCIEIASRYDDDGRMLDQETIVAGIGDWVVRISRGDEDPKWRTYTDSEFRVRYAPEEHSDTDIVPGGA